MSWQSYVVDLLSLVSLPEILSGMASWFGQCYFLCRAFLSPNTLSVKLRAALLQGSSSSAATKTLSSSISTTTVHERANAATSNVPDIVSHIHNEAASQQQQQPQPHRPPRRKKKSSTSQVRRNKGKEISLCISRSNPGEPFPNVTPPRPSICQPCC